MITLQFNNPQLRNPSASLSNSLVKWKEIIKRAWKYVCQNQNYGVGNCNLLIASTKIKVNFSKHISMHIFNIYRFVKVEGKMWRREYEKIKFSNVFESFTWQYYMLLPISFFLSNIKVKSFQLASSSCKCLAKCQDRRELEIKEIKSSDLKHFM